MNTMIVTASSCEAAVAKSYFGVAVFADGLPPKIVKLFQTHGKSDDVQQSKNRQSTPFQVHPIAIMLPHGGVQRNICFCFVGLLLIVIAQGLVAAHAAHGVAVHAADK